MEKKNLLEILDSALLEKLYGFCYARTNDSYEAQELCSDIIFSLVKAAHKDREIGNPYPYIWRIARNTYADFADRRRKHSDIFYEGDSHELFPFIAAKEQENDSDGLLEAVLFWRCQND